MMRHTLFVSTSVGLLALAGCASGGSPLTFLESNTFGVSIAGGVPEGSVELTLGYAGRNVAIVPVTAALVEPGPQTFIGSQRGDAGDYDAFSVFANFNAAASVKDGKTSTTRFGKFFATGLAADKLAEGFASQMGDGNATADKTDKTDKASKPAKTGNRTSGAAAETVAAAPAKAAAAGPVKSLMLVFGQYDGYGLSVGGSSTDLGAGLTLGYKSRNFAVVPTVRVNEAGQVEQINGSGNGQAEFNALSVLGQFSAETTGGATIDTGLVAFFTTGSAARWLAEGIKAKLKADAPGAKASGAGAKP